MAEDTFEGWAILELMGHRRLAGHVSEAMIGGASMLRIDVPGEVGVTADTDVAEATQFYSASALYCLTPCSEDTARQVARMGRPAPVQRWELPPAVPGLDDVEIVDDEAL